MIASRRSLQSLAPYRPSKKAEYWRVIFLHILFSGIHKGFFNKNVHQRSRTIDTRVSGRLSLTLIKDGDLPATVRAMLV